jgi:hypothetical protein
MLSVFLFIFIARCFGDSILPPSTSRVYSVGSNLRNLLFQIKDGVMYNVQYCDSYNDINCNEYCLQNLKKIFGQEVERN